MTILSNYRGREVELQYGEEIADQVRAIEAAAGVNEDGVIQAQAAVALFPGEPGLHTTMTEYAALVAAGCVPVEED